MAPKVRKAWSDAGNAGEPRLASLAYFALGDNAEQDAQRYLTDYYAFLGEETAAMIASSAATDPDQVKGYLAAFEQAGCGELIMFPVIRAIPPRSTCSPRPPSRGVSRGQAPIAASSAATKPAKSSRSGRRSRSPVKPK